jgi:hypothetical protein
MQVLLVFRKTLLDLVFFCTNTVYDAVCGLVQPRVVITLVCGLVQPPLYDDTPPHLRTRQVCTSMTRLGCG